MKPSIVATLVTCLTLVTLAPPARATHDTAWKAPTNGQQVRGTLSGSSCEVTTSSSNGIEKVRFYVDGAWNNTAYYAPYRCRIDTTKLSEGSHIFKVRAYSNGGYYTDRSITVNVDNVPDETKPAPAPEPRTLVWADEFDGSAGTLPDSTKWYLNKGGKFGGGRELQCYTGARPANVQHDGQGNLAFTTRHEPGYQCADNVNDYTSARLDTSGRRKFGYGRIEARMKMPVAPDRQPPLGSWPAFWTMGADYKRAGFGGTASWPETGEIDIVETLGRDPNWARLHLHSQADSGAEWAPGRNVASDWGAWHTYAVDHQPGRIDFLIDGQVVWTRTTADAPAGAWDFDKEQFLLLNVAVGGWGGTPDPSDYPATTLVDYVRVYG